MHAIATLWDDDGQKVVLDFSPSSEGVAYSVAVNGSILHKTSNRLEAQRLFLNACRDLGLDRP